MAFASAILYLDKYNGLFILHDQVNFTKTAGEIPLQQLQTLRVEKVFCSLFPVRSGLTATL
jgi:hypothetical protein